MNIRDFEKETIKGDRLEAIFRRQRELMEKYHKIEASNGLLQTTDVPVDLHDRFGQARIKDFAWRITEELGEALEAQRIHPDILDHRDEEIADALHFLVEMSILSGLKPQDIVQEDPSNDKLEILFKKAEEGEVFSNVILVTSRNTLLYYMVGQVVESLASACNCLKNKPWKTTHMLTDIRKFISHMTDTWIRFIQLCQSCDITPDKLTELYFGKSQVNMFRQRSGY